MFIILCYFCSSNKRWRVTEDFQDKTIATVTSRKSCDANGENTREKDSSNNKYTRYNLGLLHSFLLWVLKNSMASLLLAIAFNALLNTSDTASDIGMFKLLLSRDFGILAFILLGIDFLPGILVNIHHVTSSTWKKISRRQRIGSVALLLLQPFSVMLTSFVWMLDIENDYYHYLSRLSTIIHGHLESPLQFVFFFYLWSKGYMRTPLEETSIFIDRNGNYLPFGNIAGTFSLSFTISGMVKGALDTFESNDSKFKFLTFSSVNMVFRIFSLAFYVQFYDHVVYISFLVLPIMLINAILFSRRAEHHGKGISVISSLICSVVVPVSTTEKPHLYQITLDSLSKEERTKEEESRKKLSDEMRRNSALLSFCTSPIFLLADLAVVIVVNYGSYKNDSVWTNTQLSSWFLVFFLPTFFMAMLSALSMYRNEDKSNEIDKEASGESKTCMDKLKNAPKLLKNHISKNYLSDISVLGMIIIIAIHASSVPSTNSYLLGYEDQHELNLFEARTNFDLARYCRDNICSLNKEDSQFRNQDYRKINYLEDNIIYVDEKINASKLPTKFRLIVDALDWNDIVAKNVDHKICKRCLLASNPQHQRCTTLSFEGWNIRNCQGKIGPVFSLI